MGSVTIFCNADVAVQTNNDYGAGAGPHLPVGVWSGVTYRAAMRFPTPAWSGWTKVTKATLNFWISDHAHVGVRNSTILIRRQPTTDMWTRDEGTYSCNSGFSSSNETHLASDLTSTSTGEVSFTSGTTANAKKAINVTTMMQAYFAARTPNPVFLFLHNSTSDYTELWSRSAGSTYDAYLVIEFEDDTVPNQPTLNSPAEGEVVASQQPTFSWTHNDPQGNPQVAAQVHIPNVEFIEVSGAAQSATPLNVLNRGQSYQYQVRTSDALGFGAFSDLRNFTVAGYVVPTITAKYLVWSGWPRPRLDWTWSPPDGRYATQHRVLWDGYDSGWVAGNPGYHIAYGWNTTEGETLTNVRVWVQDSFGIVSEVNAGSWRTRFGVSVHRKDLGSVPLTWGTPIVDATLPGNGSAIVIQYGSNSSATSDPTAWYDSLSSVPKNQFLFIKYWFLHSIELQMPTVHRHVVQTSNTVQTIDHWQNWKNNPFGPPWSLDTGEYVYGTRSVTCIPDARPGVWNPGIHSEPIQLRAGRSYILTGLMKSQGNSGAAIVMLNEQGSGLVQTEVVKETRDWFKQDRLDTYRYKTPVYVSPVDQKVYAYCQTGPTPDVSVSIDPDTNGGDMTMWSAINCDPPHLEDGAGGVPASIAGGVFYVARIPVYDATVSSRANAASGMIPVTPGKRYRMRLATYVGGPDFNVGIWYLAADGGWIETAGQVLATGDWAWRDIDGGVAPAGAAYACLGIAFGSGDVWAAWDAVTIYEDYSVQAWFDAIKLEESTVATPWSPGAVGASAVDAGGVQIDGQKGAVFRYRGIDGGIRSVVEGGTKGLFFASDTELESPATGVLAVNNRQIIVPDRIGALRNGNLELGSEGWGGAGTNYIRAAGGGNPGAYEYVAYNDGTGNSFSQYTPLCPVSAGQVINVGVTARGTWDGLNMRISPVFLNASMQEFSWPSITRSVFIVPRRVAADFAVPADAVWVFFRFWNDGQGGELSIGEFDCANKASPSGIIIKGRDVIPGGAGYVVAQFGYSFIDTPVLVAVPEYNGQTWAIINTQLIGSNSGANLYIRNVDGTVPSGQFYVSWTVMGDK